MPLRAAFNQSARARVIIAAAMACAMAPALTAQNPAGAPMSRQAEDRRVDENSRQTQTARQTEAPKPPEVRQSPEPAARRASSPSFQRQAAPTRQADPARQAEPQRQHESQRASESPRPNDSGRWQDPGPAWRSLPPAWRDLNDRPSVRRPGEDAFRPNSRRDARRDRGRDRDKNVYITVPYAVPYPVYYDSAPYVTPVLDPEPAPREDDRPLGFLQLRVTPRTADVFVDGLLAGTVDDFGGRGARMLTAGPHRVEVMAEGYDSVTFDVRVPENDTVTFTRDLEPVGAARTAPAAAPVAIPHKPVYVVPKCYIGDRPPLASDMPAGCRVEDVRVIP